MRQLKVTQSVTPREDSLDRYMKDVSSHRMVSPEEETELAIRIMDGDEDALNALVVANLRFVITVAKQYQNAGLPLADLINEGNIGLMKAAKMFDPTRGMKFITYAVWWIRQQIVQSLIQGGRTIRIPANKLNTCRKIEKSKDRLEQVLLRTPTVSEIAEDLEMSVDTVNDSVFNSARTLSIDKPAADNEEMTMLDVIPDIDPNLSFDRESLREDVLSALSILNERERTVITAFFGIGCQAMDIQEIGEYINLSGERVRQLKSDAIRKLRKSRSTKKLKQYL